MELPVFSQLLVTKVSNVYDNTFRHELLLHSLFQVKAVSLEPSDPMAAEPTLLGQNFDSAAGAGAGDTSLLPPQRHLFFLWGILGGG